MWPEVASLASWEYEWSTASCPPCGHARRDEYSSSVNLIHVATGTSTALSMFSHVCRARENFELPHHGNLALHHHGNKRDLGDALDLWDVQCSLHFRITSTCHCITTGTSTTPTLNCTCGISTIFWIFWMVGTCLCMITGRFLSSTHCGNVFTVAQPVRPPSVVELRLHRRCHVAYLGRVVSHLERPPLRR